MSKVLSERTAARLLRMLNAHEGGSAPRRGGARGASWKLVRCTSATPVGGDDVLDQCYPAVILSPASDYPAPPEELFPCLLTVLGDDAEAVAPTEGAVYGGLLTWEVESDRTGSGSSTVNGRPRVFAANSPAGDIPTADEFSDSSTTLITADDTWQDIDSQTTASGVLELDLPDAGTYLIFAEVFGTADLTAVLGAGEMAHVAVRLIDEDESNAPLGYGLTTAVVLTRGQDSGAGNTTAVYLVTTLAAKTVKLQGWRAIDAATATFASASIGHYLVIDSVGGAGAGAVGLSSLTYVKLDRVAGGSGPTGPAGPTGATGATGPAGADGADGVQPDDALSVIGSRVFGF